MSGQAVSTQVPADDQPEPKRSLGKYVKRLSSVLRRGNTKHAALEETTKAEASGTRETIAKPATTSRSPPLVEEVKLVSTSVGPIAGPGAYARSAIQQERARALFAKYGLTLEAHEWVTTTATTGTVLRVEKPIRMRVHRTCHRCETPFGANRVCKNCEHNRCKKCPRYPLKKDKTAGGGKKDVVAEEDARRTDKAEESAAERKNKRKSKTPYLTISKTGGEMVYAPARQRIRRTCHKCNTLFQPVTAKVCLSCDHPRCTKCLRDPAKKEKWPEGYPGDVPYESSEDEIHTLNRTWKRSKQRVRWTCCSCQNLFSEGRKICTCDHERCETCARSPIKKEKKEFDPEVVRAVEEKLARFQMEHTESSASAHAPPPH